MLLRRVLVSFLGIASAIAGAFGVGLLALWALDGGSLRASAPELIGGSVALGVALVSYLTVRWLRARWAIAPTFIERVI